MKNKTHYTRVIEWSEEDQLYLGSLPELLFGHCTHGTTAEEVNRNLDECEEMALESLSEEPVRGTGTSFCSRKPPELDCEKQGS